MAATHTWKSKYIWVQHWNIINKWFLKKVRVASIHALSELATKEETGQFAKMSMDYLVDMLNDEIEGVRLAGEHLPTTLLNIKLKFY